MHVKVKFPVALSVMQSSSRIWLLRAQPRCPSWPCPSSVLTHAGLGIGPVEQQKPIAEETRTCGWERSHSVFHQISALGCSDNQRCWPDRGNSFPRVEIHRGCTFGESLEWDSAVTKHPDVIPSKNIYSILHWVWIFVINDNTLFLTMNVALIRWEGYLLLESKNGKEMRLLDLHHLWQSGIRNSTLELRDTKNTEQ